MVLAWCALSIRKQSARSYQTTTKNVSYKMFKMFKVLLHVKPNTTRKQVINALFSMEELALAEKYMKSLIKVYDITGKEN